jgi:hypothetical protein
MRTRVYIAGKIKGLPADEVAQKFTAAEKWLNYLSYDTFNPYAHISKLNQSRAFEGLPILTDDDPQHRQDILRICVTELAKCQCIHLLSDWKTSEGAVFEFSIAEKLGIRVVV